jgi:hypothetical protein
LIAAIVIVGPAVIAVGTRRCRSDRSARRDAAPRIVSAAVTRDWTTWITWTASYRSARVTWTTRYWSARVTRTTRNGMAWARASRDAVAAAVDTSGTDRTAAVPASMKSPRTHPAASAAKAATTTPAAASQRVIRDQACANEDDCCQNNESITKHGILPIIGDAAN